MKALFLAKPMSLWTPYGLLMVGFLAAAIIVMVILAADCWRRYRYTQEVSWKHKSVYCMLSGLICLLTALFVIFRRGWLMGLALLIVIGIAFQTVGGGIRNQAERE